MLPVAEDAEAAEAAHLTVDEVLCKGLAGVAEFRDRHGLVVELVLLDDGGFNGHAVVVPAGNIGRVIAAHRMGADDEVLERLIERVAHVDIAVGERRAVVQNERRLALVLFEHQAVDVDLVPVLQHARLALRQARAHREVRLRGDDGVLIVHKCLHLFLLTVRNRLLSVSGRHRTIQQEPSAKNIRRRSKKRLFGVVQKKRVSASSRDRDSLCGTTPVPPERGRLGRDNGRRPSPLTQAHGPSGEKLRGDALQRASALHPPAAF